MLSPLGAGVVTCAALAFLWFLRGEHLLLQKVLSCRTTTSHNQGVSISYTSAACIPALDQLEGYPSVFPSYTREGHSIASIAMATFADALDVDEVLAAANTQQHTIAGKRQEPRIPPPRTLQQNIPFRPLTTQEYNTLKENEVMRSVIKQCTEVLGATAKGTGKGKSKGKFFPGQTVQPKSIQSPTWALEYLEVKDKGKKGKGKGKNFAKGRRQRWRRR